MTPITLESKVRIKQSGREGIVQAVWHSLRSKTQYSVRYVDTIGRLANDWLDEKELELVAPAPEA